MPANLGVLTKEFLVGSETQLNNKDCNVSPWQGGGMHQILPGSRNKPFAVSCGCPLPGKGLTFERQPSLWRSRGRLTEFANVPIVKIPHIKQFILNTVSHRINSASSRKARNVAVWSGTRHLKFISLGCLTFNTEAVRGLGDCSEDLIS